MAFVGGSVVFSGKSATAAKESRVVMSAKPEDSQISRRAALFGALAAVLPASAFAKIGDSPKYSIFGGASQSSPFVYMNKQGTPIYKELGDEEVTFLIGKLSENKKRLDATAEDIAVPSWDDVRGELRRQMYDTRRNITRLNSDIADSSRADKAKKYYDAFKKDIEDLDMACVQKDQGKAKKARSAALKDLDLWAATAGVEL